MKNGFVGKKHTSNKKGFGKDAMLLLIQVILTVFIIALLAGWLTKENPQKPSCSLCKDVSCLSGFKYAGDCTNDGSSCGQCKNNIKTCDGNAAEEWNSGGSCSTSRHLAQCVKRTDCGAKTCKNGECV